MRHLLLVTIGLVAFACDAKLSVTEAVHVAVNCELVNDEIACRVAQTAGTREAEVCWDYAVSCGDRVIAKAPHTCKKVHGGGTSTVTIPHDRLQITGDCDQGTAPTAAISNITIDGRPSE